MSSSVHVDNREKDILIRGKRVGNTTLTEYPTNCSEQQWKFCL